MLRTKIRQFFVKHGIPRCRIAVAASGGTDSTALLLALAGLREEGYSVVAAHVNHHLRGTDSDGDEAFVRGLSARLGVELTVFDGTLDPERVRAGGIEAAAREVRYARLAGLDVDYRATAHQKNDQAETVLMRLLTGSGLAGLRGIHPVRDDGFLRPLLDVTRAEIEEFLAEEGVVARLDRSNDDPRFLRNRVRGFLREMGGVEALTTVAEQARAQWPVLERAIDEAERAFAEAGSDETRFSGWPGEGWLRGALLQRHIRRLDPGARDFDAMRLGGEVEAVTRVSVTKKLELVRRGDGWVLRRPPGETEAFELELTDAAYIPALGVTIYVECGNGVAAVDGSAATGVAALQTFQLPPGAEGRFAVRNRRDGDRFHPLGLPYPKKLKDFLIDRKIPAELRDRLPLLVWNGEIVWIAGVEVSERFKVTDPPGVLYQVWLDDDERDDPSRLHR